MDVCQLTEASRVGVRLRTGGGVKWGDPVDSRPRSGEGGIC